MSNLYKDITQLLYDCCFEKGWVEPGFPNNFEASRVNITAFERELHKVLRKHRPKRTLKDRTEASNG